MRSGFPNNTLRGINVGNSREYAAPKLQSSNNKSHGFLIDREL
jgi:hypothetical protein